METGTDRHNPSLVTRLIRSAVLWTVPILFITALLLTWFYRSSTYRLFDDPLENAITDLIAAVETGEASLPANTLFLTREPIDPRYQRALSGRYWMIGKYLSDGQLVPSRASRSLSGETISLAPSIKKAIDAQSQSEFRTTAIGPDDEPLRVLARPVILPSGELLVMIAAADIREAQRDVRRFAFLATGLMFLLSAAVAFAVFWQVRLGLRPIFDLRQRVVDVREGRIERVDGIYPSEIAPLANELNSLIDHNKDVVDRARTHVSNLAHGLKTPLAVLINEAETSRSGLSEIVMRQANSMKRQVDHHLQRARAAARGQAIGVVTSVEETVFPLARTLEKIYRDKDIAFDIDIPDGLLFRGEKRDFEEITGNLLDNACKWTQSQVRVWAKLIDEGQFTLEVGDDGPGLEEDQYSEALKRGARLDEATPGTGFGLPIVEDLAKAYKGDLKLGRSELGGLSVVLTLPGRV